MAERRINPKVAAAKEKRAQERLQQKAVSDEAAKKVKEQLAQGRKEKAEENRQQATPKKILKGRKHYSSLIADVVSDKGGDVTPKRFPNAVTYNVRHIHELNDMINEAKSRITLYNKPKSSDTESDIDAGLKEDNFTGDIKNKPVFDSAIGLMNSAKKALVEHDAANKNSDAISAQAHLTRATDHMHDALSLLHTVSPNFTSDTRMVGTSLANYSSRLSNINSSFIQKVHEKLGTVRGLDDAPGFEGTSTDYMRNFDRNYTAGTPTPSFVTPKPLIKTRSEDIRTPKKSDTEVATTAEEESVPEKTNKEILKEADTAAKSDETSRRQSTFRKSTLTKGSTNPTLVKGRLLKTIVYPHWSRQHPLDRPSRESIEKDPIGYVKANNVSVPDYFVQAHFAPEDRDKFIESIGGKKNVTLTAEGSIDKLTGQDKNKLADASAKAASEPKPAKETTTESAAESAVKQGLGYENAIKTNEYKPPVSGRTKGLSQHFGDGNVEGRG